MTWLDVAPAAYAILWWWSGTVLILLLDGLPRRTYRWTLLAAAVVAAVALYALSATRDATSAAAMYCAFTCGLLVWSLVEISFLTGALTGPSRRECPPGASGWVRFRAALGTLAHHELAILAAAAVIALATARGTNLTGLATFLALWAMRQSAKLNLYLGVRNTGEALLPPHLAYLGSYFRRRPMNALFPWSVTVLTVAATGLILAAVLAPAGSGEAVAFTLLATLVVLGALEHWLMVLPIDVDAMWRIGLRTRVDASDAPRDPLRAIAEPPRLRP